MNLTQAHCLRCAYEWIPRTANPVACPKCLSRKWNEPKE